MQARKFRKWDAVFILGVLAPGVAGAVFVMWVALLNLAALVWGYPAATRAQWPVLCAIFGALAGVVRLEHHLNRAGAAAGWRFARCHLDPPPPCRLHLLCVRSLTGGCPMPGRIIAPAPAPSPSASCGVAQFASFGMMTMDEFGAAVTAWGRRMGRSLGPPPPCEAHVVVPEAPDVCIRCGNRSGGEADRG